MESLYPKEKFDERFGAVPCKPSNLVFLEFDSSIHVKEWCEFDDRLPVHLAVDPGYDPGFYHVSALQKHPEVGTREQVWQVDEIHVQRWQVGQVIDEAQERIWWDNVVGGVLDLAGTTHNAMESHQEIWMRLTGVWLEAQVVPILDGITRHRSFLIDPESGKPLLYHNPRCESTIAEYNKYKRPVQKEGKPTQEKPIDADNHAMKALAYFLYKTYGPVARARRKTGKVAVLKVGRR